MLPSPTPGTLTTPLNTCRQILDPWYQPIPNIMVITFTLAMIETTGLLASTANLFRLRPTADWTRDLFKSEFKIGNQERIHRLTASDAVDHGSHHVGVVTPPPPLPLLFSEHNCTCSRPQARLRRGRQTGCIIAVPTASAKTAIVRLSLVSTMPLAMLPTTWPPVNLRTPERIIVSPPYVTPPPDEFTLTKLAALLSPSALATTTSLPSTITTVTAC